LRVAAVFHGRQPAQGGEYTFGESLLGALREIAPSTRHEFVYYVAGAGEGAADVRPIPSARRHDVGRAAIYGLRDVLDDIGLPQRGPHTWLERSLAKEHADLVWFATSYVERCDLPYIFTVLDIEHASQPWFPEVSAGGIWERREQHFSRYVRKATRVIAPNVAGRDQIARHYRIEPDRVLCLGHPTPTFARDAARQDPLPRARVDQLGVRGSYLLYPAQFWPHKNHATLLRVVSELSAEGGAPYELVLVGSDKRGQLAYVQELASAAGITELVHFLGFVGTEELVALYQHAHALTYVSFFGPENLPPLEAFALGCPVIAADVPGAREQLGDAAIMVSPTGAGEIAQAVRRLEETVVRRDLAARGRERAASLTPEAYVRGVLNFLDELEMTRECWP
jgi:glycosyltransferase involved in cell wall biosynthesis